MRDAHGYHTIVDRVKDVINSGGVLVASRQVEDVLYTHPRVAEVAVVGLPDDKWIEPSRRSSSAAARPPRPS